MAARNDNIPAAGSMYRMPLDNDWIAMGQSKLAFTPTNANFVFKKRQPTPILTPTQDQDQEIRTTVRVCSRPRLGPALSMPSGGTTTAPRLGRCLVLPQRAGLRTR